MGRKKGKKEKNKRKSELIIVLLIILVAAALFTISTYAWLSTHRKIPILNFSGKVDVSRGLKISLDAQNWSNEIVLGEGMNIIDNAYTGHRNISPKGMTPVSSVGKTTTNTDKDLTMLKGQINSSKLSGIIALDESLGLDSDQSNHDIYEEKYPGYFAFDIFLKNESNQFLREEILQLSSKSSLAIIENEREKYGLQNTVRVAFAKYGTGAITSGQGADARRTGVANVDADQMTVLRRTGTGVQGADKNVYITDVAIWEPNSNDHVDYIVESNNKITWTPTDAAKYNKILPGGKPGFDATTQMPTYALKVSALAENTVIDDIYFWDETDTRTTDGDGAFSEHLEKQMTLQTTKTSETDYTIREGVQNLISTRSTETSGEGVVPFTIAPNSITRLRVYVWLEGQDVDCINYASHGGGVTLDLGLIKDATPGTHE